MMTRKKSSAGFGTGSSSILIIFVLLCLVVFASLSLVSANSDQKLSQKLAARTQAYYAACNEAEMALAALDGALQGGGTAEDFEEYYVIDDTQSLYVKLRPAGTSYVIEAWEVVRTAAWEPEEGLNLMED